MIRNLFLGLLFCGWTLGASAEDGSRLWLRQDTTASATIDCLLHSQTLNIAQRELNRSGKVFLSLYNSVQIRNTLL